MARKNSTGGERYRRQREDVATERALDAFIARPQPPQVVRASSSKVSPERRKSPKPFALFRPLGKLAVEVEHNLELLLGALPTLFPDGAYLTFTKRRELGIEVLPARMVANYCDRTRPRIDPALVVWRARALLPPTAGQSADTLIANGGARKRSQSMALGVYLSNCDVVATESATCRKDMDPQNPMLVAAASQVFMPLLTSQEFFSDVDIARGAAAIDAHLQGQTLAFDPVCFRPQLSQFKARLFSQS